SVDGALITHRVQTTSQAKAASNTLRSPLEIRCAYAMALIAKSIYGQEANSQILIALVKAEEQGECDFEQGNFEVPGLFKDDPILSRAWRFGLEHAKELSCK